MGNSQSQESQLPQNPSIVFLRNSLKLKTQKSTNTPTFINQFFSVNINRLQNTQMPRILNPFCVLEVMPGRKSGGQMQWTQCCFISPAMAITNTLVLFDQYLEQRKQSFLNVVSKQQTLSIPISDIIRCDNPFFAIVVLETPKWQFGWIGLKYLQKSEQIQELHLRILKHPSRKITQEDKFSYQQEIKRIHPKDLGGFRGSHKDEPGSLVFIIQNKRPYIVGIQTSQFEITFIDESIFSNFQKSVQYYFRDIQKEKQILKAIDLLKFEQQMNW